MLPRLPAIQEDRSLLNLGNFSAFQVNITSENTSLVVHLEPEQAIPLVLYLGYGYCPNETNYDMKTHLPHTKMTGGKIICQWPLIWGAQIKSIEYWPPLTPVSQWKFTMEAFTMNS